MPKFILAPCVEDELFEIWTFIAQDNPDATSRVVEAAFETFKCLAYTPGLGRLRKFRDPRLKDIHSLGVSGFNNFVIFYRPVPDVRAFPTVVTVG